MKHDTASGGSEQGALYPALRPVYSAFVRELRVADPDPAGNADTADMLLALRGAPLSISIVGLRLV